MCTGGLLDPFVAITQSSNLAGDVSSKVFKERCEITSATAPELEISSSVPVDTLINSSFDRITNPSPTSSKGPLWVNSYSEPR